MSRVYASPTTPSTRDVSDNTERVGYHSLMADYETLLSAIIEQRRSREWTQADLAREVGVGQSAVGNWEAGRNQLRVRTMLELGAVFDLTLEWMPAKSEERERASSVLAALSRLGERELQHVLTILDAAPSLDPDVLEAMGTMVRGYTSAGKRTA